MGATSLTMSLCFMAGVFWERSKTHPYILAELGNESRGKKKPVIGTTGEKRE